MTKIYNYHPITLEDLSSQNAELDPGELQINNKKVPLVPAFATLLKPPTTDDYKTAIFNENSWEIVDDFRGLYMVNANMEPEGVYNFGALPEGYVPITAAQAAKILEDDLYYVISDGALIENPNYEADKAAREAERVSHLQCTKRVFILMLEQLGLDYYEQILPLIEANRQAKLEWELCVELERANPLLNLMGAQLGITPEQIDNLFKYANGEITESEFLNVE